MEKQISQVKDFMKMSGQATPDSPTFGDEKIIDLRVSLQQEELDEMKTTLMSKTAINTIQLADDIADQLYVLYGAAAAFGISDYIPAVFEAVHQANMTKTHETIEEAQATQNHWIEMMGTQSTVEEINGRWCVISLEGKLLKNINYQVANLELVFEQVEAQKALLTDDFTTDAVEEYEAPLEEEEKTEE